MEKGKDGEMEGARKQEKLFYYLYEIVYLYLLETETHSAWVPFVQSQNQLFGSNLSLKEYMT